MANHISQNEMEQMCQKAAVLGFRPERLLLLDQRLSKWCQNGLTPSIVMRVLRHGQLAFEGAYGDCGPGSQPGSLRADAIFPVCSITKPITSTLLCMLQEEGYLDFNQPVREFLPEFTGDEHSAIRIWHLLSHSSGLVDDDINAFFNAFTKTLGLETPAEDAATKQWDAFYAQARRAMGLPEMPPGRAMRHNTYLSVCMRAAPTHPVHTHMNYCNFGYHLAKEIALRLTGLGFEALVKEKLFTPLGMADSHFALPKEKEPRFVTRPEDFVGGKWLSGDVKQSDSGPGGLKTTAKDITRFGQMFLNGGEWEGKRILSKATVRLMTTDHNPTLPPTKFCNDVFDSYWGLGWNVLSTKRMPAACCVLPKPLSTAALPPAK